MAYPDNQLLKELLKETQDDHQKFPVGDSNLTEKDAIRIAKVYELWKSSQIKSANDYLIAAYILQYGQSLTDLQKGVECANKALELGIPPYESLVPQTTDKFLITHQMRLGVHKSLAKQRYGTQIALWMDNGKTVSFCPLDGTITEEEMTKFGLPDCRKYEGKPYQDYLKALTEAKNKAAQAWQSSQNK